MVNKLWLGFRLRCPHCGEGHINDGLLKNRKVCEVCGVRFERKSGESAGASIIWISILPIISLIFYFILYAIDSSQTLIVRLAITIAFAIVLGVIGYRHMRGLWIAVVELSDGLKTDADYEQSAKSA